MALTKEEKKRTIQNPTLEREDFHQTDELLSIYARAPARLC